MFFNEVKGQEKPIEILKAYIESSTLEGGYIFTGPEGVGKKKTAILLAQFLNCQDSKTDSSGKCASCLKIKSNQHPDVHIIESEEAQIKIEEIRRLQKEASFRAYEAEYKVFIIDNAHTLTAEASNCLLKVLEEPPKKTLIILITNKPNLLFKTITSRCKSVKFSSFRHDILEGILVKDFNLDMDYAHFLSCISEGSLGQALKNKDESLLHKKNNVIDKFILTKKPGVDAGLSQSREDVRFLLNILAAWFRDIYLIKSGVGENGIINSDRRPELRRQADSYSFPELEMVFKNITNAATCLEQNVNTRLLLYNLGMELWKA